MKSRGNGTFWSEFMAVFICILNSAIFSPRATRSKQIQTPRGPAGYGKLLKILSICDYEEKKRKKKKTKKPDWNYDAVATGIPRKKN